MSEIIIVDDMASTRHMISSVLKEEGHKVIEAVDGKDALEKVNPSVKMVITDLHMPYINGIELASMGDGFSVNYVKGKHEFFPLPDEEVQKSSGLMQYDAWR